MPTLNWNKQIWDTTYDWSRQGDEWSTTWGSVDMQWFGSILPRIHGFVPVETILEIAPGFGRCTQFLKDLCDKLILVDMSEKCIEACKKRFETYTHISYYTNDGSSLDMIEDDSIDFIFSFDSLVHAEDDIIRKYVGQISRKLSPEGIAFIHHSNLGEYKNYFSFLRWLELFFSKPMLIKDEGSVQPHIQGSITGIRKGAMLMAKLGLIDRSHMRAISMTARKFECYAREHGLECISQEIINWGSKRLIDCISVITRNDSAWVRQNKVLRNPDFMREAKNISLTASLYGLFSFKESSSQFTSK